VLAVASTWRDLSVSIFLAVVAALLAALWPWWQDMRRRRHLTALIRRELEEIGPHEPSPGKEWWEHLSKRFLHEEFFNRENVSANRDFLLSLHPSLVYHASQLWIAFEKHDLIQWRWHLRQLLEENAIEGQVSSEKAREALARWENFPNQIGSAEPFSTRPETVS
jgi:hypothetical protein